MATTQGGGAIPMAEENADKPLAILRALGLDTIPDGPLATGSFVARQSPLQSAGMKLEEVVIEIVEVQGLALAWHPTSLRFHLHP